MYRIAIVEDESEESDRLVGFLNRYQTEHSESFQIQVFSSASKFWFHFNSNFDLIFMDIELPDGNGMEVVREIRRVDENVTVIFVTNMAQYAVKGYEVRAFDFIVKPVTYYNFSVKLQNVLTIFNQNKDRDIWISNKDGKMKLSVSSILYIEIVKHMAYFYTSDGTYNATESLTSLKERLKNNHFALCNRCYLVNLKHVTAVKQGIVHVGPYRLGVSRSKQAEFLRVLNRYLAGRSEF